MLLGGVSDVIVNRLYSHGNCSATAWGLFSGAANVVVENSESIDDASCPAVATTAGFLDDDTNVTFVNDIIADVPPAGEADLSGIDVEPQTGPDNGISLEDDYIANNAGPGIEILNHPSPIADLTISGNVFSDNGAEYQTSYVPYPEWGQIFTDEWLPNVVEAAAPSTRQQPLQCADRHRWIRRDARGRQSQWIQPVEQPRCERSEQICGSP